MATLGQILKEARESKGVTASAAASATRMKVQHVEAMERDDFSRMAAPMYAKGFLKLYAEYLGLDPAPLLEEYCELHAPVERPALMPDETNKKRRINPLRPPRILDRQHMAVVEAQPADEPAPNQAEPEPAKPLFPTHLVRPAIAAAGGLLVLVAIVSLALSFSNRQPKPETEESVVAARPRPGLSVPVLKDPPEPYLDTRSFSD